MRRPADTFRAVAVLSAFFLLPVAGHAQQEAQAKATTKAPIEPAIGETSEILPTSKER